MRDCDSSCPRCAESAADQRQSCRLRSGTSGRFAFLLAEISAPVLALLCSGYTGVKPGSLHLDTSIGKGATACKAQTHDEDLPLVLRSNCCRSV